MSLSNNFLHVARRESDNQMVIGFPIVYKGDIYIMPEVSADISFSDNDSRAQFGPFYKIIKTTLVKVYDDRNIDNEHE